MGRELRITLTSFALVLASCSGGPVSDFPSGAKDDDGVHEEMPDGGASGVEVPGASGGGGDNGASNGESNGPGGASDAGIVSPQVDAGAHDLTDGGAPEAGTDAGTPEGGADASDAAAESAQ